MNLIKELTDKNGHVLVNVPRDTGVLMDMGFSYEEAMQLCLPSLEDTKSEKITAIKAYRDTVTADYIIIDGHYFHSDASSRIQQLTLSKMGQGKQIPAGLMWQTKNHGLIKLTNEIAAQFESVTMEHDMRLFSTAQLHISAVEALTTVQSVQDYDYSAGWQP